MHSACGPYKKAFLSHARLRTLVHKLYQDLNRSFPHILSDQAGKGKGRAVSLFSLINLSAHSMDAKEIRVSLRVKFWFHLLLHTVMQI